MDIPSIGKLFKVLFFIREIHEPEFMAKPLEYL